MRLGCYALAACLTLTACQKQAPIVVLPHTQGPRNLRVSERPLDPRRIKGTLAVGDSALLAVEPAIAGDRVSTVLEVPTADCVVVIARGSETIEDLDLLAYGEDGTPLGNDEASDREPSLLICPPHPERVLLAARVAQGHGIVAVGAERVPPALAGKAAERYHVKPRDPNDPARLKAWPGLETLILRERARVGGRFQDLRRVALALDASVPTTLPASIEAGGCVHALFVPSDDVAHLDVAVLDDEGRILGRALGSGRQRTIVVCSPVATEVSFEIRPHAGRGLAVAALSRSIAGSESEIEGEVVRRDVYPSHALDAELKATREKLEKLGYKPATGPKLELKLGRRISAPLTLGSGCTRLDLVGGAPLRGLDARLWSDTGQLRASGAAGGSLTLFACGAGKLRLDAASVLNPGPAALLLNREPDVPAELGRAPLAAGRLISRMVARGALLRPSAIGKVSELSLSPEQLTSVPVLVPLDRCLEIDVGIEGGAGGVELRAIDQDSDQELDSSVGEGAASSRLCAYAPSVSGSLNARIELRTTSGQAKALLATRLLQPAE
jgi:hypothetical protein